MYPNDPQGRKTLRALQEAQQHAERLGKVAIRAIRALAITEPQTARILRAEAADATRGVFIPTAQQLLAISLPAITSENKVSILVTLHTESEGPSSDAMMRELERVLAAMDPEITVTTQTLESR